MQDGAGTAGPASSRSRDSRKHLRQALRGSRGSCRSLSRSTSRRQPSPSLQDRGRGLPGTNAAPRPSREGGQVPRSERTPRLPTASGSGPAPAAGSAPGPRAPSRRRARRRPAPCSAGDGGAGHRAALSGGALPAAR